MRFSFKTATQNTSWAEIRDMWREADQIEVYDAGWTFDHFYPIFSDPAGPCLEGWSVLAALAAITRRLRLGVMVSANTYRHPAVLANMAATVDHVSDGRLEIGLGAGWFETEHDAYGIELPPLRERFDRFEEACEVLHRLLTEEEVNFAGRHYRLTAARCEPKAVQRPRPPLVVGGSGEKRTLRIAARWADQWNYPMSHDPAEFRRKIEVLHEHCDAVGRDPADIEISAQFRADEDATATAARTAELATAGADHVIVYFAPPFDPGVLEPTARALAELS